nr:hypothetical protein [Sphingomonas koreensis]
MRTERNETSSGNHPLMCAKSSTAPIRCNMRRALSGIFNQMGDSTSTTQALSTSTTGFVPINGKTWFSKLEIQLA